MLKEWLSNDGMLGAIRVEEKYLAIICVYSTYAGPERDIVVTQVHENH